jgi:hypothetical protein
MRSAKGKKGQYPISQTVFAIGGPEFKKSKIEEAKQSGSIEQSE